MGTFQEAESLDDAADSSCSPVVQLGLRLCLRRNVAACTRRRAPTMQPAEASHSCTALIYLDGGSCTCATRFQHSLPVPYSDARREPTIPRGGLLQGNDRRRQCACASSFRCCTGS